jgi:hypothetical protein
MARYIGKVWTRAADAARSRERRMKMLPLVAGCATVVVLGSAGACTPTIKLAAPDKPIEINLNVKIDQEVKVRIDRDLEDLIAKNPDLF